MISFYLNTPANVQNDLIESFKKVGLYHGFDTTVYLFEKILCNVNRTTTSIETMDHP